MADYAVDGQAVDIVPTFGGFDTDPGGRMRTSGIRSLWSQQFRYSISPLLWDTVLTTGGTVPFTSATRSATPTCTASTGSAAYIQSHNYMRYQPGKPQMIKLTCDFDNAGTEFAVVVRKDGADTRVTQANFNGDKVNGTGSSGFNIDNTKAQLFIIDFLHLGVGNIRFWVVSPTIGPVLMHTVQNPNNHSSMWIPNPVLPIRAQIVNNGTNTIKRVGYFDDNNGLFIELRQAAGASSFNFFCSAVESEEGSDSSIDSGVLWASDNFTAGGKSVTTAEIPLLALRPKATFNSLTNRGTLIQQSINMYSTSRGLLLRLYLRPTLTGAAWTSVDAQSFSEFDTTATAFSGGYKIGSFAIDSAQQSRFDVAAWAKFGLSLDALGTTADILLVTAQAVASSTTVYAGMDWSELV